MSFDEDTRFSCEEEYETFEEEFGIDEEPLDPEDFEDEESYEKYMVNRKKKVIDLMQNKNFIRYLDNKRYGYGNYAEQKQREMEGDISTEYFYRDILMYGRD